ncbi:putative selenate reductase subunit YgfK [Enterococcus rivorum]|uniref:dihydrouracil dehydrogenase (NAD(+)) n=1 Tax=Enterococcus rivorum TaxID=762845 RepID=A0A1E5KTN5_9ENTE|nr:putative selenate reductase subunit YgfK [Enterococcus rivorum]MBP2097926.1 putative selenate reductase [Enterococcus rivorum]OEH81221.1 putative selenate reductase subunit YgfK [Enterococcus rivorum]
MSDIMHPISIDALLNWVLKEYKNESSIFGVRKFYKADTNKMISLFGEKMETPCGPAAGPHTQLAQNIIASYLTGSRFFEVKTVQIIDGEDLPVSKPCITAADECYNVEWSTELRVPQAYDEYVKGWFVLKLLSKELGLGNPDGFIFNMSVGYDLEGIKSPKIDKYITDMQDAEKTPIWQECKDVAYKYLSEFKQIDKEYIEAISPKVCRSITLSTLHGCPSDEIERITTYLLEEKGLNSFIKCNPTMLGYEYTRKTLDDLGFDYMVFDDHHFLEDLQFEDAVPMLKRLQALADSKNLSFGVKITNTFPVGIAEDELPGEEMYMSGRSLFPLSISLAKKLSDEFNGKLQISYSGGADVFNIKDIFDAGIWPITMATTLLKPGGYQRMNQVANLLTDSEYPKNVQVDLEKLSAIVEKAKTQARYKKSIKISESPKLKATVPLTNCYTAPCRSDGGCPINQDIPAYLRYVNEGNHLEALKVIVDKNPLPFITGTICAHPCMTKCTRQFYESSIQIREMKLKAAEHAYDELMASMEKPTPKKDAPKTAVVGGGPAGISAGYLLAREGMPVTVFEKADTIGGVCSQIVPEFRISMESVQKDVDMAKFMGTEFKTGKAAPSLEELRELGYTNVIYAIGAWKHGKLKLEVGETINSLDFLKANRENPAINPYGEKVVIVGGGNTAMDCARAATTLPDVKKVSVVYRRDKRNMPADEEELYLALEDGVEFLELLSPIKLENNVLTCEKMRLGERDASGRRKPVPTGEYTEVPADTVIAAVGEKVDTSFYESIGIQTNQYGKVVSNQETLETNLKDVYVIGDANLGPATIVEAIADATKAAKNICEIHNNHYEQTNINEDVAEVRNKRGILIPETSKCSDAGRCLECSTICESCMDVCPNRANIVVQVKGQPQIVHVDRMCNECGNCETFCPYASAPYKDKFTLFNTKEDFENSTNSGFYVIDPTTKECLVRLWNNIQTVKLTDQGSDIPKDIIELMDTMIANYDYCMEM